ncbi:hypothetical protein F6455_18355 [Proteobacteria bacterium 005FR1]|nr:hypothetical protein [Proteobacteria bacterium 005FR1]
MAQSELVDEDEVFHASKFRWNSAAGAIRKHKTPNGGSINWGDQVVINPAAIRDQVWRDQGSHFSGVVLLQFDLHQLAIRANT